MTDVAFNVPANNGTAGHATTQTSVFVHIPSAPSSSTSLFDYNLGAGDHYRASLGTDRHVRVSFALSGYGSATVDLGALPVGTWTWLSCGFSTAGGLHVRADMTPSGGGTTTGSALASSGSNTGQAFTAVPFGLGVPQTGSDVDFPNNAGAGWLMSKFIQTQIASDAASGNPEPVPTTDFAAGLDFREYLAHDALGAASILTDSGTAAIDLPAGPQGLTIVDDGPPLQPGSPGPGGAHEGDLSMYQGGVWTTLHVGTTGQELTVVSGEPAWTSQPIASAGTLGDVKVGSGLSVAGDGTLSVASGTGLPTGADGDVLIYKSGAWLDLGPGNESDVLTMVAGYPAWSHQKAPLTDSTGTLVTDSAGDIIMA